MAATLGVVGFQEVEEENIVPLIATVKEVF